MGEGHDGGAAKALLTPAPIVNKLPTKTQSPSISMELLDICIVLLIRSLLSLWWSKVWTTLRLETQRVNTFNRAAMDTGLEDWNPLMHCQQAFVAMRRRRNMLEGRKGDRLLFR